MKREIKLLGLRLALIFAAPQRLTAGDSFYDGKTIKIIVGFTSGGFYDRWSRLLARYVPKYFPGNPEMIVQNMPGAGEINCACALRCCRRFSRRHRVRSHGSRQEHLCRFYTNRSALQSSRRSSQGGYRILRTGRQRRYRGNTQTIQRGYSKHPEFNRRQQSPGIGSS